MIKKKEGVHIVILLQGETGQVERRGVWALARAQQEPGTFSQHLFLARAQYIKIWYEIK